MAEASAMRMLFVVNETFPTSRVDVDVLFRRELAGRGHQIEFVMQAATPEAFAQPGSAWPGSRVRVGPTDVREGFFHRLRRHWLAVLHDVRWLRRAHRMEYDCIQVRDKFVVGAIGVLLARMRRIPFFFWLSFPEPEANMLRARHGHARYPTLTLARGWLSGQLLYRVILPLSNHVFVQSEIMKRGICARGIDPARVTPVPMGVDTGELVRMPQLRATSRQSRIRLVYLGVVAAERRMEILIDMLSLLRTAGVPAFLTIVGDARDAHERAALEARAAHLGVSDCLAITGFVPRAEALQLACSADVGLSPIFRTPIFEVASPTKLVEYMALGLPVVANDQPEQRLVLRESRAGVCTPWGARHFARAVAWLARRTPEERQAMGRRGKEWVEAHRSYRRVADAVEKVYVDVMRG
jgi:glycosyltransferase involved in cell wall biosynthesis